jgi:hypothetical protein
MSGPIDDQTCYERLHKALLALGAEEGATVEGATALKAARRALHMLGLALILKEEVASGAISKPQLRPEP